MRNHIVFKFLSIGLCAAMLLVLIISSACILGLTAAELNHPTAVEKAHTAYNQEVHALTANRIVRRYAARYLGGFSEETLWDYLSNPFGDNYWNDRVLYTLADEEGTILEGNYDGQSGFYPHPVSVSQVEYPIFLGYSGEYEGEEDFLIRSGPTAHGLFQTIASSSAVTGSYLVTLYLAPNALVADEAWDLAYTASQYQSWLLIAVGVSALLFAVFVVYLCCAAGHTPGSTELRPGGMNRMPLELYGCLLLLVTMLVTFGIIELGEPLMRQGARTAVSCICYVGYIFCLSFVGFCYAFVAQVKTPGYFWWKNSLTGRMTSLCIRLAKWMVRTALPFLWHFLVRVWKAGIKFLRWLVQAFRNGRRRVYKAIGRSCRKVFRKFSRYYAMLPLIWQWLVVGFAMLIIMAVTFNLHDPLMNLLGASIFTALIIYGAGSFGTLLENARKMRQGNLDTQINDDLMVGGFRDFAEELNAFAGVASILAQKQLQSERMKTELITNVSHDIKTPLTSIINYVDLLSRPHTPEQEQQYIEVLSRQSARLKKLIEDLMEMSKAASGNIAVELVDIDGAEAVNQAIGEFGDKLAAASLTPVFRHPEEQIFLRADGRLLWRCLSNVLSNAVKYALPGTRLYIDLTTADGKAMISLKNISRDQLNVSANELLERFVRGDSSRNTEGSGLGLNIAKSLMELQKGELQLLVDGDLFKVTLVFPAAVISD